MRNQTQTRKTEPRAMLRSFGPDDVEAVMEAETMVIDTYVSQVATLAHTIQKDPMRFALRFMNLEEYVRELQERVARIERGAGR
jgi:hypothetical protein